MRKFLLLLVFLLPLLAFTMDSESGAVFASDPKIMGSFPKLSPGRRDRLRLEDIDEYRRALQRFYDFNRRYPVTDKLHFDKDPTKPLFWQIPHYFDGDPSFAKVYDGVLGGIHITPVDGPCTYDQNRYIYNQTENGQSYTFDFCIGTRIRGLKPGVHTLTPSGIK